MWWILIVADYKTKLLSSRTSMGTAARKAGIELEKATWSVKHHTFDPVL